MLRRSHKVVGICLTFALASTSLHGCVAYNFSSEVLPLQQDETRKALFQSRVLGVESPADKSQSYALEKFLDNLTKSGVFKAVGYLDRLPSPDLVLSSFVYRGANPYEACLLGFQGQLLTIVSLGIIPQICKSDYEVSFALHAPRDKEQKQTVAVTYHTRSILGWAALFYLPSSDWTGMPPKDPYPDLLRAVFYRQADDIQRLLQ